MEQTDYSVLLPKQPPEGMVDWLLENGGLEKHFLVYKNQWGTHPIHNRKERMEKVVCSSCQSVIWACITPSEFSYAPSQLIEIQTGLSIGDHCPCCGIKADMIHSSDLKRVQAIVQSYPVTVENINGHLAILCWCVEKIFQKDGSVLIISSPYEGYVVEKRKIIRLKGWMGTRHSQRKKLTGSWQQLKNFSDSLGLVDLVYPWESDVLEGTVVENSKLDLYLLSSARTHPIKYLKLFLKHPNVENLVTQGAGYLVEELICNELSGTLKRISKLGLEHISWTENRPAQMLGLQKVDFKTLVTHQWDAERIFIYSLLKQHGIHPSPEEIEQCRLEFGSNYVDVLLKKGLNPTFVANYLKKQKKKDLRNDFSMLRDYWDMGEKVGYQLENPDIQFPSRLFMAHERVMELHKKESIRINEEKMAECFRKREHFAWEQGNILIRPVKSSDELKEEGRLLHHCVYSYAKKVEQGKTSIFFIRSKKEPDKPWFTLEFDVELLEVDQNRGKRNCEPPEEVKEFVNAWIEHIKELEPKNKRKIKRKEVVSHE